MNRSELTILILLRIFGIGGLLAIPAVFLPYSWMDAIHAWLGMGTLPEAPIVDYLARALSAFYAILGGITLFISFDLSRYRELVRLWSLLVAAMGLLLLWIDFHAEMPLAWSLGEGPPTFVAGMVVRLLSSHIRPPPTEPGSEAGKH